MATVVLCCLQHRLMVLAQALLAHYLHCGIAIICATHAKTQITRSLHRQHILRTAAADGADYLTWADHIMCCNIAICNSSLQSFTAIVHRAANLAQERKEHIVACKT